MSYTYARREHKASKTLRDCDTKRKSISFQMTGRLYRASEQDRRSMRPIKGDLVILHEKLSISHVIVTSVDYIAVHQMLSRFLLIKTNGALKLVALLRMGLIASSIS